MKLLNCTETQRNLLQALHPDHDRPHCIALVPAGEYFFWTRMFNNLLDTLSAHFSSLKISSITSLPVIQCVSKFVGQNSDGFLVPKTFKFNTLDEGNLRDFGFSTHMLPLLETLNVPYPLMKLPESRQHPSPYILGFLAWDDNTPPRRGAQNLPRFVKCTSNVQDIQIDGGLYFEGKHYSHLLPTYKYYPDSRFQKLMRDLQDIRQLLIPINFPLSNLKMLEGFTNPGWAEVKSLEFFLDESPDNLQNYVLIRIDDGKIVTWEDAMKNPKLRLEMEMSDYWLWQEACPTTESLQHINMYWEFGTGIPWLFDKKAQTFIPVYVVED